VGLEFAIVVHVLHVTGWGCNWFKMRLNAVTFERST